MEDLYSESDLDMTRCGLWCTAYEAPAAEPGPGAEGGVRKATPDTIGLPWEGRFRWHQQQQLKQQQRRKQRRKQHQL